LKARGALFVNPRSPLTSDKELSIMSVGISRKGSHPKGCLFMVILMGQSPKKLKTVREVTQVLAKIDLSLSQIERKLLVLRLPESFMGEGTPADRIFVNNKIKELQSLVSEIDNAIILFAHEDISTFNEKKAVIALAQMHIGSIRDRMLSIWEMRNSGSTLKENEKIEAIITTLFKNANNVIQELNKYAALFNPTSPKKLTFRVKWTPFPK
jgi:hypothetical protein